jgi:pyruvate/2-oxoglutarate/acetoin dehydrogenase E1 component
MREITYNQAIEEAQVEEMRRDKRVFIMGTDVQSRIFGSERDVEEFGVDRVRNTPITEAGITGAAAGAAMLGLRPIVNLNIAPFLYPATDQIISVVAKSQYLYGGQTRMPVVIRASVFYGVGSAAQHSDRPFPMFMNVPGLKIIAPATARDAKGLLKSAIRDDDPVICIEDRTVASKKGEVPEDPDFLVPLGEADVKRSGTDVTIVGVSGAVLHALTAADMLEREGISAEVVDLRSLVPLDRRTVLASVAKTGRLVVVDPSCRTCSVASEVAAIVAEEGFEHLRAPVQRVTTPDVHIPYSRPLELPLFPDPDKVVAAVRRITK